MDQDLIEFPIENDVLKKIDDTGGILYWFTIFFMRLSVIKDPKELSENYVDIELLDSKLLACKSHLESYVEIYEISSRPLSTISIRDFILYRYLNTNYKATKDALSIFFKEKIKWKTKLSHYDISQMYNTIDQILQRPVKINDMEQSLQTLIGDDWQTTFLKQLYTIFGNRMNYLIFNPKLLLDNVLLGDLQLNDLPSIYLNYQGFINYEMIEIINFNKTWKIAKKGNWVENCAKFYEIGSGISKMEYLESTVSEYDKLGISIYDYKYKCIKTITVLNFNHLKKLCDKQEIVLSEESINILLSHERIRNKISKSLTKKSTMNCLLKIFDFWIDFFPFLEMYFENFKLGKMLTSKIQKLPILLYDVLAIDLLFWVKYLNFLENKIKTQTKTIIKKKGDDDDDDDDDDDEEEEDISSASTSSTRKRKLETQTIPKEKRDDEDDDDENKEISSASTPSTSKQKLMEKSSMSEYSDYKIQFNNQILFPYLTDWLKTLEDFDKKTNTWRKYFSKYGVNEYETKTKHVLNILMSFKKSSSTVGYSSQNHLSLERIQNPEKNSPDVSILMRNEIEKYGTYHIILWKSNLVIQIGKIHFHCFSGIKGPSILKLDLENKEQTEKNKLVLFNKMKFAKQAFIDRLLSPFNSKIGLRICVDNKIFSGNTVNFYLQLFDTEKNNSLISFQCTHLKGFIVPFFNLKQLQSTLEDDWNLMLNLINNNTLLLQSSQQQQQKQQKNSKMVEDLKEMVETFQNICGDEKSFQDLFFYSNKDIETQIPPSYFAYQMFLLNKIYQRASLKINLNIDDQSISSFQQIRDIPDLLKTNSLENLSLNLIKAYITIFNKYWNSNPSLKNKIKIQRLLNDKEKELSKQKK